MNAYMMMWLNYCKKNSIWFAVCADGSIDQVSFVNEESAWCGDTTFEAPKFNFGTKEAYTWLIRTHKKLIKEIQNGN